MNKEIKAGEELVLTHYSNDRTGFCFPSIIAGKTFINALIILLHPLNDQSAIF